MRGEIESKKRYTDLLVDEEHHQTYDIFYLS